MMQGKPSKSAGKKSRTVIPEVNPNRSERPYIGGVPEKLRTGRMNPRGKHALIQKREYLQRKWARELLHTKETLSLEEFNASLPAKKSISVPRQGPQKWKP